MAPTRNQTPNPPRAPNKWLCFCAEFSTRYMTAKQNAAMTMNPEEYRKMAEQLPSVAKLASEAWWRGGEPLHRYWEEVARRQKIQHRQSYPNYTYQPQREILVRQRPRTPTPTPAPAPAPALGDMGNGDSSEARTSVPSGFRLIKPNGYVAGGGAMDVEREDRPPPAGSSQVEIIDLTHDDDDDDKHVDVIEVASESPVNRHQNANITRQADVIDLTEEEDKEMSVDASAEMIEEIQRTSIVPPRRTRISIADLLL